MKRELKFFQVDTFTDVPFGGNPASVILNANHMDDEQILKIAREFNVRETVFVSSSSKADFRFRYMTPFGEIDFSGHATVAAFHALVEEGLIETAQDVTMVNLEIRNGILQAEIVKNEQTGVPEIQITHRKPVFMDTYDSVKYAEALGLNLVDIMSLYPIQTVSTGIPNLIVPVISLDALKKVKPNWGQLNELAEDADYLGIEVFTKDALDVTSDAHARHFAPAVGVEEDPVTGSAAGGLGSYLVHYGIISATNTVSTIVIEQGHFMERPGKVIVEVTGGQHAIEQVKVSGTAITVAKGRIFF